MQRSVRAADNHLTQLIVAAGAIVFASALVVAGLLVWLTVNDPFGGKPHPSDAEMLAQFQHQRLALEAQVATIKLDPKLERVAPDFTRPEDPASIGVPPERIAEYRSRLRAAGIAHGFSHYGDAIEFIVSTRGLAISGSAKGFVYAEAPDADATVVDGDLDAARAASPDKSVLLQRKIDGNWWLQLDTR
jgi:hypothetical protein